MLKNSRITVCNKHSNLIREDADYNKKVLQDWAQSKNVFEKKIEIGANNNCPDDIGPKVRSCTDEITWDRRNGKVD